MRTIRRISPGSVFKVTFVIYALLFALFGCLAILLPGLVGSSILSGLEDQLGFGLFAGGMVTSVVVYVVGILVYGLISGIFAALGALVYNLIASWVGGIVVELD